MQRKLQIRFRSAFGQPCDGIDFLVGILALPFRNQRLNFFDGTRIDRTIAVAFKGLANQVEPLHLDQARFGKPLGISTEGAGFDSFLHSLSSRLPGLRFGTFCGRTSHYHEVGRQEQTLKSRLKPVVSHLSQISIKANQNGNPRYGNPKGTTFPCREKPQTVTFTVVTTQY